MHGGVKVYRGAASAARAYVEADTSRVDDYYLAEGTGLACRFTAADGVVEDLGVLDGDSYEQWVAGYDPETGDARGRLRKDGNAVRFVEITVNGPKTWSLAAALHPTVAEAYDAAQNRAAEQIVEWVAEHATTRVGPRGRQVQVPVERIEAVTVRHFTSRAGDPHRHLHLQFNARVFAQGTWRGLHTVGFRDSIEALNGIGHAAVMTDPQFRSALASVGFSVDPASGEVLELAPYVGEFSERAAQISRNIELYEVEWRTANPGQEPGPAIRRSWDRRAWKDARPDKVVPIAGDELEAHWNQHLYDLGYSEPVTTARSSLVDTPRVGDLDRDAAVGIILTRLGARRSAWNAADVRGEAEKWIAGAGLVADAVVRRDLAEDITARVIAACVPLVAGPGVPEHVRSLTSDLVLAVENDIVSRLAGRVDALPTATELVAPCVAGLDEAQLAAVAALTGDARLVLVEGAAGAGKTTTLGATMVRLANQGQRMLVATPTLKGAQVASREVGTAVSAAWFIHQHGFRWDDNGHWARDPDVTPVASAVLTSRDVLLVDEAGMLDQDTARALLTVADELGARVALLGDRHQLPAVGRGGVLDLAARWVAPDAHVDLDVVHRFADEEYAAISLALRTGSPTYPLPVSLSRQADCGRGGEPGDPAATDIAGTGEPTGEGVGEVWGALWRRDQIRIYASDAERTHALAKLAANNALDETGGVLVIADTREQTTTLNGAVRDHLVAAGHLENIHTMITTGGARLGVGDRVVTRRNDRDLAVSNRDVWTVTGLGADGSLVLRGLRAIDVRTIPADYARDHVELAYATTVYGAQGETAGTGHLVLGEHTSAASAYVGMSRGRNDNIIHIVAEDRDDARAQWDSVFARDRADLGPAVAAQRAAEDVARYGTQQPTRSLDVVLLDLRAAWSKHADLESRHQQLVAERDALGQVAAIQARHAQRQELLGAAEAEARREWLQAYRAVEDSKAAVQATTASLQGRTWNAWRAALSTARHAADVYREGAARLGRRRRQARGAAVELTEFAERWRAVIPDLPHSPEALAQEVPWLNGRRVADQINAYITQQVAEAHPDSERARQFEHEARAAFDSTERNLRHLADSIYNEVRPYGRSAHTHDASRRLAIVADELAVVERDLEEETHRVAQLQTEPTVRALPPETWATERRAWAADRAAQRDAARQAQLLRRSQQEVRRTEPHRPPTRNPGQGLGR